MKAHQRLLSHFSIDEYVPTMNAIVERYVYEVCTATGYLCSSLVFSMYMSFAIIARL